MRLNRKGEEICDCHRGSPIRENGKCQACNEIEAEGQKQRDVISELQDKAFYLEPSTAFEKQVKEILIDLTFRLSQ